MINMPPTSAKYFTKCVLFASVSLLILFAAPPAIGRERALTPHDVAKLKSVTEVTIAPNGTQIAYVLSVQRKPLEDEDGPAWTELHLVAEDGKSRPFVSGEVNVSRIAWTPDGEGISFLAKRGDDEHKALYVIPAGGGEARQIVSHNADLVEYAWSPNGEKVAFLATEGTSEEKKELGEKGFNQEVYEEDWQPVRVWIATLDKDDAEPTAFDLLGSASELHWSPTGSLLALALAPTPLVDDRYTSRKVHVVNAHSGKIVARFDNPGKLGQVVWSPDATHLAMISAADPNDPREGRLVIGTVKDGKLQYLLSEYEAHVNQIGWSDTRSVLFTGDEGVWTTLNEIGRDGSGRKTILSSGGPIFTRMRLSADGQSAALIGQSPFHPPEVFIMRHRDTGPKRLTESNPWLDDLKLAPQEVVAYEARDGLDLEGLLIRPLNEKKRRRYPLILIVHGGPESHYRNGWLTSYSLLGQVAAARGFAVFYPNYRGSTGRGLDFSKLSQADPAGKEFDDLVDAVDHLVEVGLVDRERVGITGGSYGGFATAWCSTYYSDRFAAGVMRYGISDQFSKYGTTDIPEEMFLVHQRRRPWDDWQFFLERSPIYHAKKSETPLLILHGKADTRVHPVQSMELFRYLKVMNQAPVRLVLYPGEPHGYRRAASRLDYNLRAIRWLEHYLKGPGGEPPPYDINYKNGK